MKADFGGEELIGPAFVIGHIILIWYSFVSLNLGERERMMTSHAALRKKFGLSLNFLSLTKRQSAVHLLLSFLLPISFLFAIGYMLKTLVFFTVTF